MLDGAMAQREHLLATCQGIERERHELGVRLEGVRGHTKKLENMIEAFAMAAGVENPIGGRRP